MSIVVPVELLPHLRRARDVADRNYAEPLDLAALAAAAGVSKYHFLRCFAAAYGETPMQYVTRRRIERATDLLRATKPPLDEEATAAIKRMMAKGTMHGFGIATDDCRKTFAELTARGVEYIQEPSDRPYGVEAVLRDNSGNWLVLVEQRPYTAEDFT